jgi:hypothetical protein
MKVERSAVDVEAQESYGQRVILQTRCRHRLACADAVLVAGARVHLDGLVFADEAAAQRFERGRLVPDRQSWQTFASWTAAQAWLRESP